MKEIFCIGDWGDIVDKDNVQYLKNKKKQEYYLLGDNFYPAGVKNMKDPQWKTKFNTLFPKVSLKYCCLGNHDYLGDVFSQIKMTFSSNNGNWNLPYFFHDVYDEKNSIHTFFIDTQIFATDITIILSKSCGISDENLQQYLSIVYQLKDRQIMWLENKLKHSNAKWKIICGHYPVISNGPHQTSSELRDILLPIIKKYNVDLYISGHEHNTQCIQENNCLFIISGAINSNHSYHIQSLSENTLFYSTEKGFISLLIEKRKLNVLYKNILENTEKIIYHKQKN